jgi:hypothetical protein
MGPAQIHPTPIGFLPRRRPWERDSLLGLASMLSSPTDKLSVAIRFHVNDLSCVLCSSVCTAT